MTYVYKMQGICFGAGVSQMGHKSTFNVWVSLLTTGLNYRSHLWGDEQILSELEKTDHLTLGCFWVDLAFLHIFLSGQESSSLSLQSVCSHE